ncbi:hypothetical protein RHECNPAF_12210087 [Rhizobium etli CNPAF512]|nr:hypothetical protein RHECNPAF_12210087 [Rhizobium etli CNPAF512]
MGPPLFRATLASAFSGIQNHGARIATVRPAVPECTAVLEFQDFPYR